MRLSELFKDSIHEIIGADINVNDLEYDSRKTQKGNVFACIVGTFMDGHEFAASAVNNGAVALLVERPLDLPVPQVIVGDTRVAMAKAAEKLNDYPAKKMKMVGITGTNGKTTTTYMIKSIAEQAGKKVGLIGTISNMIGSERIATERTTPESVDLQRLLARMYNEGVQVCIMEVSSHSLDQRRVYGIEFDVGVFSNLTQDHLDYHKTFENYRAAKKKLFEQSKYAVINIDDHAGAFMAEGLRYPVVTYGIREKVDISATEIDITTSGVTFDMHLPGADVHIKLGIPGLFSVFNAMASAGAAYALSFTAEQIKAGLESIESVSGRLESLDNGGRDFSVLLDYAHTPDAMENILKTVQSFAKGRIVTLFGCGGDRDRAKRPIMGEIAGRYSDLCILTSDNPRSEKPMDIIKGIEEGVIRSGCAYKVIENRKDAIFYALENGLKDDVVILAGKGHETYQEINGVKSHFDEKEIVAEYFAQ